VEITEADKSEAYYLSKVLDSGYDAIVLDKDGKHHLIEYGLECSATI
jgi:hypothetical protein